MVRRKQLDQLARKFAREVGIAICDVGDEVNEVVERRNTLFVVGAWRLQEKRVQSDVLVVLVLELFLVRTVRIRECDRKLRTHSQRITAQLVLQVRQVSLDLLKRSNFSFRHSCGLSRLARRAVLCRKTEKVRDAWR